MCIIMLGSGWQNAQYGRFAPAKRRFAPWCEAKRPFVSFCIFAFRELK